MTSWCIYILTCKRGMEVVLPDWAEGTDIGDVLRMVTGTY